MTKKEIIKIGFWIESIPAKTHKEKIIKGRQQLKVEMEEARNIIKECQEKLMLLKEYDEWLYS